MENRSIPNHQRAGLGMVGFGSTRRSAERLKSQAALACHKGHGLSKEDVPGVRCLFSAEKKHGKMVKNGENGWKHMENMA